MPYTPEEIEHEILQLTRDVIGHASRAISTPVELVQYASALRQLAEARAWLTHPSQDH